MISRVCEPVTTAYVIRHFHRHCWLLQDSLLARHLCSARPNWLDHFEACMVLLKSLQFRFFAATSIANKPASDNELAAMLEFHRFAGSRTPLASSRSFSATRYPARQTPSRQERATSAIRTAAVETIATEQKVEDNELHHLPDLPNVQPDTKHDGILLQGFGWDSHKHHPWYQCVGQRIPEMQAAGVTHLWLPPPSQSVSPEGYMPGQLYNLTSSYGNQEELTELINNLKAAGIVPMADIVINHRCADTQDEHGRWNNYRDDHDHDGHAIDWGRWAIVGNDHEFGGKGNSDTGDDFWGAPDLDHANPHLREALVHWLQHLRDNVGFMGWRFDFARGYAGKYIKEYVDGSGADQDLNVGELWVDLAWGHNGELEYNQDAARQRICDWIDAAEQRSAAFDFVTKGILQEAVKRCEYWRLKDPKGKAPGLIGWWPRQSVTFIDNHDTGSSQQHWPFPSDKVGQGYAYLLTHPGTPCLFWEHIFDWGDDVRNEIKTLIKVRQDAGLFAKSKLEILAADGDMYVSRTTGKYGTVVLKMGPRYDMGNLCPKKDEGWQKAAVGKDYCVWLKMHEDAKQQ